MEARGTRVARFESEMLQVLSSHLQNEMSRPLPCFASFTSVEAHANLRHARVFVRLVGNAEEAGEAEKILLNERARFQKTLAREIPTRFCPVLRFEFGLATAEESEIDRLIRQMRKTPSIED